VNHHPSADTAIELDRLALVLRTECPDAVPPTMHRADVLRDAPPDVPAWAYLAQRGDGAGVLVLEYLTHSQSGAFPSVRTRR
jgi:hypothetical protein